MGAPDAPILQVSGLCAELVRADRRLPVLEEVSFAVRPGEVLGVVGESGAGKSIAGAALIGLLPPAVRMTGGEIRLAGERIDGCSQEEMRRIRGRRMGTIFQDPMTSLNPLYKIGDQLVETMRTHLPVSAEEARARALALLEEVGIPDPAARMEQYPHQFSGGMRQRVVIALAICAEPEVVIADEPTTALDVSVQAQVLRLLDRLRRELRTAMLIITHDMGVIGQVADDVAVMYAGRIVEKGPAQQVLERPRHPYSAGLMAAIPRLGARQPRLAQIPGTMPALDERAGAGCPFAPRCHAVMPVCRSQAPPSVVEGASETSCWLHAGANAREEPDNDRRARAV